MADFISADVPLLVAVHDGRALMQEPWIRDLDATTGKLDAFFNSRHDYGPSSSSIPAELAALFDEIWSDGASVAATAWAFQQVDALGIEFGMRPTDAGIEALRRQWLEENHPDMALDEYQTTMTIDEVTAALEENAQALSTHDSTHGPWTTAQLEEREDQRAALVAERDRLLLEGFLHLTNLQNAMESRNHHPTELGYLLDDQAGLVHAMVQDEAMAREVLRLLGNGTPVARAFEHAEFNVTLDARVAAIMDAQGVSEADALRIIERIDATTLQLVELGVPIDEAAVAAEIIEAGELDLDAVMALHNNSAFSVPDAAAVIVMANQRDMTVEEFGVYTNLQLHYQVLESAQNGVIDDVLSRSDLEYVINNADDFPVEVVQTAQDVLDNPQLFARLDDAISNTDILDEDSFGHLEPDDWKIHIDEIAAFELKQSINNLLFPYADRIDGANGAGAVDDYFSRKDWQSFLDNPPPEFADDEETLQLVQYILDQDWHDQGFWEAHRDDLAKLAALGVGLLIGGAFVVLTGGTGLAVLGALAVGFAGGAAAAGGTTVLINAGTGQDLTDGLAGNMIQGGFIGMGGASLPLTIAGGGPASTWGVVTRLGVFSETTGIVAAGGVDILIPEDWEDEVHTYTGAASLTTGVATISIVGGRYVIRRIGAGTDTVVHQVDGIAGGEFDGPLRMIDTTTPPGNLGLRDPNWTPPSNFVKPAPNNGHWLGDVGNSTFVVSSDLAEKSALNAGDHIEFVNGVPDFGPQSVTIRGLPAEFSMPDTAIFSNSTDGMNAIYDHLMQFAKPKFNSRTALKNFLSDNNISAHHFLPPDVQLVPYNVHGPVHHYGGSAVAAAE